jgi:hypothetical protein
MLASRGFDPTEVPDMNVVGTLAAAFAAGVIGSDPEKALVQAADAGIDLSFLPVSGLFEPGLPHLQQLLAGTPLQAMGDGSARLPFLTADEFESFQYGDQKNVKQLRGTYVEARVARDGWILAPQDARDLAPTVEVFRPAREERDGGIVIVLPRIRLEVEAADLKGIEQALASDVVSHPPTDALLETVECTDAIRVVDGRPRQVCRPGTCPTRCQEVKGPTVGGAATFACDCGRNA